MTPYSAKLNEDKSGNKMEYTFKEGLKNITCLTI